MFEVILINSDRRARVDDVDQELVESRSWYLHSEGYVCGPAGIPLIHRLIMDAPLGKTVDHRNGDKLDNVRSNLRIATYSLNAFNRQVLDKRNQCGVPGVSQRGNRWAVYIFKGKRHYLGMRDTLLDAARLRAEGEMRHFGEVSPVTANLLSGGQRDF